MDFKLSLVLVAAIVMLTTETTGESPAVGPILEFDGVEGERCAGKR